MEEEKVDLIGNIELKNYELYFGTRKDYFIPKLIDFEKALTRDASLIKEPCPFTLSK